MPAAREVLDCADPHIVRYAYMVVVIHAHGHSLATGEIIRLLNRVSYKRRTISPKLSTVGTYSTVIGHLFSPAEVTAMIVSSAVSRPLFVCLFVCFSPRVYCAVLYPYLIEQLFDYGCS
jgi:hypothetical protein